MKKLVAILGITALARLPSFQSNPSSTRPRHCSVEKGNGGLPYPESLKGSGIQGIVLIQAVTGENGCTQSVRVVRKLHPKLDELAKQAVNSWKFSPATKDGKPVKVRVQIEVKFKDTGK
jgi:protein TonB